MDTIWTIVWLFLFVWNSANTSATIQSGNYGLAVLCGAAAVFSFVMFLLEIRRS